MRKLALAGLLLLSGAARAGSGLSYTELPPGRYSIKIHGMICTVSARAIAAEWEKLPEIDKAAVDFDRVTATVSVKLDRTVQVSALKRALKRAARVANLDERYDLHDIEYIP